MARLEQASICYGAALTSHGYKTMMAPHHQCCHSGHSIVITGGPQAARSQLMDRVSDSLLERGFSLEIYRNWIDPDLISGFRLLSPALSVIDDELAGSSSSSDILMPNQIMDLSSAWDYVQLRSQKKALCTLSWQAQQRLKTVASYLRELEIILQERKSYVADSMDFAAVNRTTQQLIAEIFARPADSELPERPSQLFATAITANGLDTCVNTLVKGYKHFYLLRGEPGSGRSTILARLSEQAVLSGLAVRSFYGPLEPDRRELLLIPRLATAIISATSVSSFQPSYHASLITLRVIELGQMMRKKRLAHVQPEWLAAQRRFDDLLASTTRQLAICKTLNETVTAIYQEYLDRPRFDAYVAELLTAVMNFIDDKPHASS